MQNEPTCGDSSPENEQAQRRVLTLVVDEEQRPWSVEEVVRSLDRVCPRIAVEDALAQLRILGLINQAGELFFASQAAAHIAHLDMFAV